MKREGWKKVLMILFRLVFFAFKEDYPEVQFESQTASSKIFLQWIMPFLKKRVNDFKRMLRASKVKDCIEDIDSPKIEKNKV